MCQTRVCATTKVINREETWGFDVLDPEVTKTPQSELPWRKLEATGTKRNPGHERFRDPLDSYLAT